MQSEKIEMKEKSEAWPSVDTFVKLILYDNLVPGSWLLSYRAAIIILTIGKHNLGIKSS